MRTGYAHNSGTAFCCELNHTIDLKPIAFGINTPQVHVGIIASGDQFVGDADQTQTISQEMPGTPAVEMNAAVAQVCAEPGAVYVRVISIKPIMKPILILWHLSRRLLHSILCILSARYYER